MVNVLAAVPEFQRDMTSENTREGVAAAEASGKALGRPAALDPDQAAKVVEAFGEGTAVKALAGSTRSTRRRSAASWTLPAPASCPSCSMSSRVRPPSSSRTRRSPSTCPACSPTISPTLVTRPSGRHSAPAGPSAAARATLSTSLHRSNSTAPRCSRPPLSPPEAAERKAHRVYATRIAAATTAPCSSGAYR
ncbi:hypothetical protein [Streptomyces sp. NPDC053720]|uniref:hypothetical protein n=1 Tax=Streptomyces sp. NPDC053720 TaxID=3154855 RepID=UPI0034339AB9